MEKQNIRLIGLDLDGTLLDSGKNLTVYTQGVIREAIKRGITVLPATGRPYTGLPAGIRELGMRYAITANGARVIDMEEERVISSRLLPFETGREMFEIFEHFDALIEIYYDGVGYADGEKLKNVGVYYGEPSMSAYVLQIRRPTGNVKEMFLRKGLPTDKLQAVFSDVGEKE